MFGIMSTAFLASAAKQLFEVKGNNIYNFNTTVMNEKKKKYSGKDKGKKDILIVK